MKREESSNLLAYLGIFVLLLFIILPPLLRVVVPKNEKKEPVNTNPVIMGLACTKNDSELNYSILRTIESTYNNGELTKTIFTYDVSFGDDELTMKDITISDFLSLKKISGADVKERANKYIVTFNYTVSNYSNNKVLENHRKKLSDQLNYYSTEGYNCTTAKQN